MFWHKWYKEFYNNCRGGIQNTNILTQMPISGAIYVIKACSHNLFVIQVLKFTPPYLEKRAENITKGSRFRTPVDNSPTSTSTSILIFIWSCREMRKTMRKQILCSDAHSDSYQAGLQFIFPPNAWIHFIFALTFSTKLSNIIERRRKWVWIHPNIKEP